MKQIYQKLPIIIFFEQENICFPTQICIFFTLGTTCNNYFEANPAILSIKKANAENRISLAKNDWCCFMIRRA